MGSVSILKIGTSVTQSLIMFVILRVRATSAAPGYFRSFSHAASKYTFDDGALRCNNPVFVADKERKVLWPSLATKDPDIFLSIGTGFNQLSRAETTEGSIPVSKSGVASYVRKLISLGSAAVLEDMNCEMMWQEYIQGIGLVSESRDSNRSKRYQRLNLPIIGPLPKLDEVDQMELLQSLARRFITGGSMIKEVAMVLQASLFYFDLQIVSSAPTNSRHSLGQWDCDLHCTGNYLIRRGSCLS